MPRERGALATQLLLASLGTGAWLILSVLLLTTAVLQGSPAPWEVMVGLLAVGVGTPVIATVERRLLVRLLAHDTEAFYLWLKLDDRRAQEARRAVRLAEHLRVTDADQARALLELMGLPFERRLVPQFSGSYRLLLDAALAVLGALAGHFLLQ